MQPTKITKTNKFTTKNIGAKRWALVILVTVTLVGLGVYLANDLPLRARYSVAVNEVESIKKDILEPAGGMKQANEDKRGNGIIDVILGCEPDVACPTVAEVWVVPIEKGKEHDFAITILKSQGYEISAGNRSQCSLETRNSCGVIGKKDNLDLSATIMTLDSSSQVPSTDVGSKEWRKLNFRITN